MAITMEQPGASAELAGCHALRAQRHMHGQLQRSAQLAAAAAQ